MPDARPSQRAPWIIAGVAGVVFIALLVIYLVPLAHARDAQVPGQLTADEQRAMDAASTEVINILSYSRGHFDADYQRALAGATGALRQDITSKNAAYRRQLTAGKFDTSATVTNQALVGPSAKGDGYVVLLTVNSVKSDTPNTPIPFHLQVTVVRKGTKFVADDLKSIEVS